MDFFFFFTAVAEKSKRKEQGQSVQLQTKIANTVYTVLASFRQITTINTLSKYSVDQNTITYIFLHL